MNDEQELTWRNLETESGDDGCTDAAWHDPLDTVIWAVVLVWAGLVWLASSLGTLPEQAWSVFFLGAGVLVLIELAIRLLVPALRKDLLGTAIWAGVLFCLGGWASLWPLVLVGIGVALLLHGLSPKLKTILVKEESQ